MNKNEDMWQIVNIPGNPPIPPNQQPTVDVYACVVDPKLANTLIRRLAQIAPLEDLRHVKRIRKRIHQDSGRNELTVILCLAFRSEDQLNRLPQDVQDLVDSYQLSPFIAKVSKYAASSKEEWEEQCKLWPTSYHPLTYNINGIGGFSEEEMQSAYSFMKLAIELALSCDNLLVNAAVIVDPSLGQVIATATDQVHFRHTPGSKNSTEPICYEGPEACISPHKCSGYKPNHSNTAAACLDPWEWPVQDMHIEGSCYWHPLQHAAMAAIESSAARDRRLFPGPIDNGESDNTKSLSSISFAKRQKTSISDEVKNSDGRNPESRVTDSLSDRPYLCTGYDIYLVWEPCAMCAMGLVHQRVKRIFYAFPNHTAGALGSIHRIQGEKSLNHHYAVFRVLMPEQVVGLDN